VLFRSLRDAGGKTIGAIHSALDITEEERLRQQLYHADKMSALGQMISGIAHEVNNPLTGILGFTELLLDQFVPQPQKDLIEKINIEANRATHVMRSLLSLARDHKPKREATDLCRILTECLNIRAHDFQMKNIRIVRHFQDVPLTTADPNKLRQVFMNIITNAEHAILDHAGHGTIMVDIYRNNGFLEVNISDDGPGIPLDKAKKIFEPFYTTKEAGKGTGLGLAISHAIIAEHEGTIEVQKSSLGGTSFVIKLPLIIPQCRVEGKIQEEEKPVQKANVLVVDDEPSLRKIISVALGKQGHMVRTASCAYDALRLYKEEAPDLLVLDMKMPGMGGIELCEHLPKPLPPIIAMSGDTVSEEIQVFATQNGAEFLPKPFTIQEILQAVARSLSKTNRV
jgi:CheY-like chemotaxis protein